MTELDPPVWQPPEPNPPRTGWYNRRSSPDAPVLRHYWTGSCWQVGKDWTGAFCPQHGFEWRIILGPPSDVPLRAYRRTPDLYPPTEQSQHLDRVAAAFWSRPLP